jgi:hypothetical protein
MEYWRWCARWEKVLSVCQNKSLLNLAAVYWVCGLAILSLSLLLGSQALFTYTPEKVLSPIRFYLFLDPRL